MNDKKCSRFLKENGNGSKPESRSFSTIDTMEVFISRGTENFGPYSPDDLATYLRDGSISPTDLAWYEGVQEWTPVAKLPFLTQEPTKPPAPPKPEVNLPIKARTAEGVGVPADQERPKKNRTAVPFTLAWLVMQVGCAIVAMTFVIFPDLAFEQTPEWGQITIQIGMALVLFGGLGTTCLFWGLNYNAWRVLPSRLRITSPAASAWLLYLPVFNLYWFFRTHIRLSHQYDIWASETPGAAPEGSTRGLGIGLAVLTVVLIVTQSLLWAWLLSILWCGVSTIYYGRLLKQAAIAWKSSDLQG